MERAPHTPYGQDVRVNVGRTKPVGRVGALVAVALLTTACADSDGDRDAQIMSARLTDGRTLSLNLDACNATSNRAEVDERPGIVTVSVTTDDPPGGDDCSDGITVDLEGPLAGRRLRDGSTGVYVQVMDVP